MLTPYICRQMQLAPSTALVNAPTDMEENVDTVDDKKAVPTINGTAQPADNNGNN